MAKITATFRRRGDLYDAAIQVDGKSVWGALSTKYETFIRALSEELKDAPDARLVFERTDREGLAPWLVTTEERDQIRDNPIQYIAENTGFDRRVLVRDPTPQSVRVGIRCGYDTLSDSFGDHVYVRLRDDGKVECPLCGRWRAEVVDSLIPLPNDESSHTLSCSCMPFANVAHVKTVGPWVEIPTASLALNLNGAQRFYIPRSWNNPTGWISRAELSERYSNYIKETQNV